MKCKCFALDGTEISLEEEGNYGRICDISVAVIARSLIFTKIQPTVHRALRCTWKHV